jgi:hypothetical protein
MSITNLKYYLLTDLVSTMVKPKAVKLGKISNLYRHNLEQRENKLELLALVKTLCEHSNKPEDYLQDILTIANIISTDKLIIKTRTRAMDFTAEAIEYITRIASSYHPYGSGMRERIKEVCLYI